MPLKKREIDRALTSKLGCEVDDSGKHRVFMVLVDGLVVAKAHTSHGGEEDIRDQLVKQMATQLRVPKPLFVDIVSCRKSRPEYEAEFRRDG